MSIDESPDEDEPNYGPSETENVFGKEITKARPIALLSGVLTISISIYLLYTDSSLYLVATTGLWAWVLVDAVAFARTTSNVVQGVNVTQRLRPPSAAWAVPPRSFSHSIPTKRYTG